MAGYIWRALPKPDELRKLLCYDPKTGALIWKRREGAKQVIWNAKYPGKPAGGLTPDGGIVLKIDNRGFSAHRVIWAMVHGRWPDCIIHKNGVRSDNRVANLMEASRLTCQRRQRRHKTNTSGRTGVSWNAKQKCWIAQIRLLDRTHYLGRFAQFSDAVVARKAAEIEHGFAPRI